MPLIVIKKSLAERFDQEGFVGRKAYLNAPIVLGPPIMFLLALAAFIRRMLASILLVLGALDASIFPEPVFPALGFP